MKRLLVLTFVLASAAAAQQAWAMAPEEEEVIDDMVIVEGRLSLSFFVSRKNSCLFRFFILALLSFVSSPLFLGSLSPKRVLLNSGYMFLPAR